MFNISDILAAVLQPNRIDWLFTVVFLIEQRPKHGTAFVINILNSRRSYLGQEPQTSSLEIIWLLNHRPTAKKFSTKNGHPKWTKMLWKNCANEEIPINKYHWKIQHMSKIAKMLYILFKELKLWVRLWSASRFTGCVICTHELYHCPLKFPHILQCLFRIIRHISRHSKGPPSHPEISAEFVIFFSDPCQLEW